MRSKRIAIRRRRRAPSRRTNAPPSLRRCSRHCSPILLRAAAVAAHRRGAPKTMMMIHVSLSHKIDSSFSFAVSLFSILLLWTRRPMTTTTDRRRKRCILDPCLSIDRSIDRSVETMVWYLVVWWNSLSLSLSLSLSRLFGQRKKKEKKNRNPKWSSAIILSFLSQKPDYSKKRIDSVSLDSNNLSFGGTKAHYLNDDGRRRKRRRTRPERRDDFEKEGKGSVSISKYLNIHTRNAYRHRPHRTRTRTRTFTRRSSRSSAWY